MTQNATLTLTDFLLARIAEDEYAAQGAVDRDWQQHGYFTPARVLAECEAKRQIVAECAGQVEDEVTSGAVLGIRTLRLLGLPYADHADYRPEWRP